MNYSLQLLLMIEKASSCIMKWQAWDLQNTAAAISIYDGLFSLWVCTWKQRCESTALSVFCGYTFCTMWHTCLTSKSFSELTPASAVSSWFGDFTTLLNNIWSGVEEELIMLAWSAVEIIDLFVDSIRIYSAFSGVDR